MLSVPSLNRGDAIDVQDRIDEDYRLAYLGIVVAESGDLEYNTRQIDVSQQGSINRAIST